MRKKTNLNKKKDILTYAIWIVSIAILITVGVLFYNISKNGDIKEKETIDSIAKQSNKNVNNVVSEQASSTIGNKIENTNIIENNTNVVEKKAINTAVVENKTQNETTKEEKNNEVKEEIKKELEFVKPVEGEILKEFAKDTLIYSNTLGEWTTHCGIDIKADKTTVVKSAEEGMVKYIKNDPRYGLTVVVEHIDGYSTVYANLLTAEFVTEGEKVAKGQTIGSVGNTSAFEIVDESHLHFEILKDGIQLDPNGYLK